MCLEIIYLIYTYKKDLALNNLQWLICHKTKPNQTRPDQTKVTFSWKKIIVSKNITLKPFNPHKMLR